MVAQPADFNSDKLTDYVIVLHKEDEEEISQKTGKAPRRPLLVFMQKPDRTFELLARNDNIVFAVDGGGQCDPFMDSGEEGIAVKGSYFTVQNEVACGAHWTDYITFKYSEQLKDLVFHKRIYENWTMNTSQKPNAEALVLSNSKITTSKKNAPVLLKNFQP